MNKKVVVGIIAFVFLTVSVGLGVFLALRIQKNGVGAAGANLTLSTNNSQPAIGQSFVVAVSMDTKGLGATGVDLKLKYDSTRLSVQSIQAGTFLPNVLIGGTASGGIASIVLSCPIDTVPHPATGVGIVAQVTFIANVVGTSTITFDPTTKVSISGQTTNMIGTTNQLSIIAAIKTPNPHTLPPTSTPTPTVCGGIQGLSCPAGKTCIYSDGTTHAPHPDATGTCQTIIKGPTPTPTRSPSPSPTPVICATGLHCSGTSVTGGIICRQANANQNVVYCCPTGKIITNGNCVASGVTPTPSPKPGKPGDVNGDGKVNIVDIGILIDVYNDTAPLEDPRADLNKDGRVNIVDVGIVVDNYQSK